MFSNSQMNLPNFVNDVYGPIKGNAQMHQLISAYLNGGSSVPVNGNAQMNQMFSNSAFLNGFTSVPLTNNAQVNQLNPDYLANENPYGPFNSAALVREVASPIPLTHEEANGTAQINQLPICAITTAITSMSTYPSTYPTPRRRRSLYRKSTIQRYV